MARTSPLKAVTLSSLDDIFGAPENQVLDIPLSALYTFKDHPFYVQDDEDMMDLADSIKRQGVLTPIMVRPRQQGGYEIIAGHRRRRASELAGLKVIPAFVRTLDDDAAVIKMVDTNLQRQLLLPSEKAFAYKMKLDAMKRQAGRPTKDTAPAERLRSDELLAEQTGDSRSNIQRFVRLTELHRDLLSMVDDKLLSLNAGVELSFLDAISQELILQCIGAGYPPPSLSQAVRIKQFCQEAALSAVVIQTVLSENKQVSKVSFSGKKLQQYFPRDYSPQQMEDTIIQLLDAWRKNQ